MLAFIEIFSTEAHITNNFFNFADWKQCLVIWMKCRYYKQWFYYFDFQIIVIN